MKKTILRRLLAAVLCLMMVLSLLTACSKKNDGNQSPTAPSGATTPTVEDDPNSTYTTPLENSVAQENAKSMAEIDALALNQVGGLFKEHLKGISEIEKQAENYAKTRADAENQLNMTIADKKEMYGEDYEFYCEVTNKSAFSQEDLTLLSEEILSQAEKELKAIQFILLDEAKLEREAEASGLTKEQCREKLNLYKKIYTEMRTAQITEGYELDYTIYVKGSSLEEPAESDSATDTVCKVNGKWVYTGSLYLTSYYLTYIVIPGSTY